MNKSGLRIEPCGVTDSIFFHELQKDFIFPPCFLSVFLYGLVTCSKAIFLCLTVRGKEIAGMGFRYLSKSLKGEEDFFKPNPCKSGSSEIGGETCPKMEFNSTTIRHGRESRDHLHDS